MLGTKPDIDFSKDEIILHEYRPNRFVIVVKGKILRVATKEEVTLYQYYEIAQRIDAETIAVGLAISAVSAVLATSDADIILRALAAICFALSVLGSMYLFSVFIGTKIPETMYEIMTARGFAFPSLPWTIKQWVLHFASFKGTVPQLLEFGYLSLLLAFTSFAAVLIAWVILSFF